MASQLDSSKSDKKISKAPPKQSIAIPTNQTEKDDNESYNKSGLISSFIRMITSSENVRKVEPQFVEHTDENIFTT